MAEIISVNKLLKMNLDIPRYQRPYKWDIKNIGDLFLDITNAISDAKRYDNFKYRIGTIILHKTNNGVYNIVDGQQRIISLVLLRYALEKDLRRQNLEKDTLKKYGLEKEFDCSILTKDFKSKITQNNIHKNYTFISECFSLKSIKSKLKFGEAFETILEVVVICVDNVNEAFQLFDSQNTRGKALDPHDLLKAYHLRAMKDCPYEMQHAVTKWEAKETKKIKELFDLYLFPIWNWSRGFKSKPFTSKEIDTYKGIEESSPYSYARRASRASPFFQITDPFTAGNDFFEMVDHYINLLWDIKSEICANQRFETIKFVLVNGKTVESPEDMDAVKLNSVGFVYAKNLFLCALFHYYDKFHNFDEMAVKKLFSWAFMLRVDMENLGFDSVNKYAIGDENILYTNKIGIFSKISFARTHHEISSLQINIKRNLDKRKNEKWSDLYKTIKEINGYGEQNESSGK